MKKLILIAMLLGLTGCNGDDSSNSSNVSLAENQSRLTNTASPTPVMTRALSTSSLASPFGGWELRNHVPMGASSFYGALMGSRTSSVVIVVDPTEVAKVLRNGVAGVALSVAVEQLLGAVDWVLDPVNNQILYRDPNATNPRNIPKAWCYDPGTSKLCFSSPNSAKGYYKTQYPEFPSEYIWKQYSDIHWYLVLRKNVDSTSGGVSVSFLYIDNPYYDPTIEDRKALSLETVAQKVIDNANDGSLDAQVATMAAASQIIAEAEQDDVKAKPIVDELERNAHDNNDPKCRIIQTIIHGNIGSLSLIYQDMLIDRNDLYNQYRTEPHPQYGSWDQLGEKYYIKQTELGLNIATAQSMNCSVSPSADIWSYTPAPDAPATKNGQTTSTLKRSPIIIKR